MVGNIIDYLEWYGRFGFDIIPFNEVDNLILAEVTYARLDGIVPVRGSIEMITAKEAAKSLDQSGVMSECCRLEYNAGRLLMAMGECTRFENALMYNYVNKHDFENEEQFAALHIDIDDGTTYIAFSGTDDTILGWKEDFNMAYLMPVPAQAEAVRYLNETLEKNSDNKKNIPIRVGGHSKGGNLAVYASMKCNEDITNRIINIYNNDGPGFLKSMLENEDYIEIADRIQTIVPETSIIGMLLDHGEEYKIVKSIGKGLMQHDGFNWQVCTDHFVMIDERSKDSMVIDETVTKWINAMNDEQRAGFIDAVYELLTKAGIHHLSDFEHYNFAMLNSLIKEMMVMNGNTAKLVGHVVKMFLQEYGKNVVKGMNIPSIPDLQSIPANITSVLQNTGNKNAKDGMGETQ